MVLGFIDKGRNAPLPVGVKYFAEEFWLPGNDAILQGDNIYMNVSFFQPIIFFGILGKEILAAGQNKAVLCFSHWAFPPFTGSGRRNGILRLPASGSCEYPVE